MAVVRAADDPGRRWRVELVLGSLAGLLAVVTAAWHDWIELVLGVDPDHGSGYVEWLIVAVAVILTAVCLLLAQRDRRLLATATTGGGGQ
jgi:hypothetical protein